MSRILRVEYYPKPDVSVYTFRVVTENLNPKTEVIVFKISYDFFYPIRIGVNLYEVKVHKSKLSVKSGTGSTDLRVRLFSYAFLEDRNYYVCIGSINLYNSSGPNNLPLKKSILTRASDSGQPWIKNLRVTSVYGPYQNGQIVKSIDLNKPVRYIAYIGGQKFSRAQFLAIKWSYSIDGGEKQRFKHQKEWNYEKLVNNVVVYDDHAVMECNMLKSWNGKNISVYAFFRGESERVKASASGRLGSTIKRKTNSGNNGQLIWGNKVSDEFQQKVIQICSDLWGENRKIEMANALMAVMSVETARTFKAHIIAGQNSRTLIPPEKMTIDDFKKGEKSSRAVGLIQFTQVALESLGDFKSGTGFDKLHEVKLRYARMGEIKQLDKVKDYLYPSRNRVKTAEDLYLQIFAPIGVGKSNSFVLYKSPSQGYLQNKSLDDQGNENKKIERGELLQRYYKLYKEGEKNMNGSGTNSIPEIIEEEQQQVDGKPFPGDPMIHMEILPTASGVVAKGRFGYARGHLHMGTDLGDEVGTPIFAAYGGTISGPVVGSHQQGVKYRQPGNNGNGAGNRIYVSLSLNGKKERHGYWHLSGLANNPKTGKQWKAKEEIEQGQIIGYLGSTGNANAKGSGGPHLHFMRQTNGVYTDPEEIFTTKFDKNGKATNNNN